MDEVERELLVPAGAEEAWRAVTESDWLGEGAHIDPRPGGEVEAGGRHGFVEEADAPRRLAFWWSVDNEDATRVEVELQPVDAGTLLRVTESRPLAVLDAYGSDLGAAIGAPSGPQALALA